MADEDFGLACPHCWHVFPNEIAAGVVAAHMEVEHGIGTNENIKLELVVLCPRCRGIMPLERTEHTKSGMRHHHYCYKCKRSKTVNQNKK